METSGFVRTCNILQISAVCENREFDKYLTPVQPIPKGSTEVTKLSVINGQLCFNGTPVNTVSVKDGLLQFIEFLRNISHPVLVGHNIKTFDLMFLHHHLNEHEQWDNFVALVTGFVDTKLVFRKEYPVKQSCTQSYLMTNLLHKSYSAHNALDDVRVLQKPSELVKDKFPNYTFTVSDFVNSANMASNKRTLQLLLTDKAVTDSMAGKTAWAGLNYNHPKLAFDRKFTD